MKSIPTMPQSLRIREYATFDRKDSKLVFGSVPELHRDWGLLFCEDSAGQHWTVLGSHGWVQSLRSRARQASAEEIAHLPPSPSDIPPVGECVDMYWAVKAEWPLDQFHPKFVIRGWPDEWQELGHIDVFPYDESWESLGH
jgi:hypothetical protein